MRVHSQEFKKQIKEMGRELDSKIIFGETVLGNGELNAVTPSFQGTILKSVMKQLDIDSNVVIPIGTILNYKFGVKVNGEYEYLDFGNYVVKDVEKQEDTMSYKITCYDKLLFSMKDYAKMPITYPITIRSYINAISSFLGIRFANNNDTFVNYNKTISNELYLDTNGNSMGYTFRDVLDELAQVTASTICLNENDELEIRYINDTEDTIDEEFLKDVNVNFGEKYGKINSIVLSRSGESDNVYLRDESSVQNNGLCELKIIDNQIMNWNDRDSYLPEILGKLNGLEYYLNDFSSTGIAYYDLCDRYSVIVGDKTYSCVMFNDELLVTQGLEENVFTEIPQETETDYTKADKTDRKINQTYLIVDKQNQKIESVVSQTIDTNNPNSTNSKVAKLTQKVGELESSISEIADITTSAEDTDAQVELDNINESEPIRLVIRPIGESINYDYPYEDYPQEDFSKIRTIRFTNTKTEEVFDYILPIDLLYYDSEHYDEFILDYEGQTCMVNKRVGYNADHTTYVLDNEQIIECEEYPRILLTEGDYRVEVLGYENAYIFVRLMAQNIYTTQFYTKAETDSIINQTSQNIDLSVNKKLSNYSTTTQMNSAIQLSASNITSNVSENYATKNELGNTSSNLNSKIEQTASSITSSVSNNYATKNELNNTKTEIKQTTDNISSTVSKKVGNDEIISKINQSVENVDIDASKINMNGVVTAINNDTTTTINGNKITTGTLSADKISSGTINASSLTMKTSKGYLEVGTNTEHPKVSGLNVGSSGVNVNGLGFNSNGNYFNFSGGVWSPYFYCDNDATIYGDMICYGEFKTNNITPSKNLNLKTGGADGEASDNGVLIRTNGGHISLDASNNGKNSKGVYARGLGLGNGSVSTSQGQASSKNTKENIIKFEQKDYDEALKLLNDIDLYSYDYKYNLYKNNHQYGFIIDEIEEKENYSKFFDFYESKAKVNDKDLDFAVDDDDEDVISVKQYQPDTLDKYLLTCLKAMQNKIETLENKIKELESEK